CLPVNEGFGGPFPETNCRKPRATTRAACGMSPNTGTRRSAFSLFLAGEMASGSAGVQLLAGLTSIVLAPCSRKGACPSESCRNAGRREQGMGDPAARRCATGPLRERVRDRLAAHDGAGRALEVARAQLVLRQHLLDRGDDRARGFAFAEMLQHH